LILSQFPDLNCRFCCSAEEALQELERTDFDALISDLRMPKISGQDLLTAALSMQPSLTVIMLTAYGTVETAVAALKEGAYDFLAKPIDQEHLFRILGKALERSRLLQENTRLREKATKCVCSDMLVGESQAMRRLHKTIAAVAPSDYTVLLRVESGTDKELVARSIQALSKRANAPFVIVNARPFRIPYWKASCSSMSGAPSPERIESAKACSSHPTVAPSCSMKSATFRQVSRPSFCGSSRTVRSAPSAPTPQLGSICAFSHPPTGISRPKSPIKAFGKICISGSTY